MICNNDGKEYVVDNKLFKEGDLSERNIFNILKGSEYKFNDEDSVYIIGWLKSCSNDYKSKNMYNELFRRYPKYFNDIKDINNFNSLVNYNMDELIRTSQGISYKVKDINQKHKIWNVESFDTRESVFYDDSSDKYYTILFSIANLKNGKKIAYAKKYASSKTDIF